MALFYYMYTVYFLSEYVRAWFMNTGETKAVSYSMCVNANSNSPKIKEFPALFALEARTHDFDWCHLYSEVGANGET